MTEKLVRVVVDEALSENGKSYLKVELYDDRTRAASVFNRNASPQQISNSLNGTGCYIKYDEEVDLPEEEKNEIGDLYIRASYNVPGL